MQGRNTDRKTKHLHNSWELHSVVLANSAAECSESRGDTSWERTGTALRRHRDLARLAHIAADSCSRQRDCSERRSRTAIPWSCKARYPTCYALPSKKEKLYFCVFCDGFVRFPLRYQVISFLLQIVQFLRLTSEASKREAPVRIQRIGTVERAVSSFEVTRTQKSKSIVIEVLGLFSAQHQKSFGYLLSIIVTVCS